MQPIDVAVVGLGVMGRQHLRVLRQLPPFRVVALCDPDIERALQLRGDDTSVATLSDMNQLGKLGVTAAVLASPTSEHFEQTSYLASCGISLLVEKPLVRSLAEAASLGKLLANSSASLLVGHIERFNPAVQVLRRLIRTGTLGDVLSVSASRVGVSRPVKPTTNVIFDLAIHDIDVTRFLLGTPLEVLAATGGSLPGNALEDYASLLLACGRSTVFTEANWITPRKRRALSVTGSEGFLELDYVSQTLTAYPGQTEVVADRGDLFHRIARTAEPISIPVPFSEPLERELIHFAACIRGQEQPAISVEEAIDAVFCCDDATRLIRERCCGD